MTELIEPWANLILALVLGCIAVRQTKRANDLSYESTRLALFDRRYQVFLSTRKFIAYLFSGDPDHKRRPQEAAKMNEAVIEAEFLFPRKLHEELNAIYLAGSKLKTSELRLARHPAIGSPDWNALFEENARTEDQLWKTLGELSKVFAPYLSFAHLDASASRENTKSGDNS